MSRAICALVTGATGGLGQAIAERLMQDGLRVLVVGRDAERAAALQKRLSAQAPEGAVRAEACDLRSDASVRDLAQRVADAGFLPDVLVNNAAIQGPIGPLTSADWAAWSGTVAVDLLAPALLAHLLVPAMATRGWGRVINISGGGATGPRPGFSAYAVAKTGLVRLTETLAHELSGTGVTVNAVAPGPMNTKMLDEVLEAGPDRAPLEYSSAVARAREGGVRPERAAALVAWLSSRASDGISGRLLSAVWDPWARLGEFREELAESDVYTLRRIVPADRGRDWGEP